MGVAERDLQRNDPHGGVIMPRLRAPYPPAEADGQGRPVVCRCGDEKCGANYITIPTGRRCELCHSDIVEVW